MNNDSASVAVLRIKRKRTDDPLKLLLSDIEPNKKRRIWELSRTADQHGVPIPISTGDIQMEDIEPPRFSVRKSHGPSKILDLEPAHGGSEVLNQMLSEYLQRDVDDYVYDIYYPAKALEAIQNAEEAIKSNYGLLEHFDWDENSLVYEEDESSDEEASEDSNAESWIGNDYPDEESSIEIVGSDNEEQWDQDDWKD